MILVHGLDNGGPGLPRASPPFFGVLAVLAICSSVFIPLDSSP